VVVVESTTAALFFCARVMEALDPKREEIGKERREWVGNFSSLARASSA